MWPFQMEMRSRSKRTSVASYLKGQQNGETLKNGIKISTLFSSVNDAGMLNGKLFPGINYLSTYNL